MSGIKAGLDKLIDDHILPDKKLHVWRDELMNLEGQLRRWRSATTDFIADRVFKLANEMDEIIRSSQKADNSSATDILKDRPVPGSHNRPN